MASDLGDGRIVITSYSIHYTKLYEPYVITQFDFTKPGKGQALYKCKMRNMITGNIYDRTYRSGESFEPAALEDRDMQFLYQDDTGYVFMDSKTYDQITLSEATLA